MAFDGRGHQQCAYLTAIIGPGQISCTSGPRQAGEAPEQGVVEEDGKDGGERRQLTEDLIGAGRVREDATFHLASSMA